MNRPLLFQPSGAKGLYSTGDVCISFRVFSLQHRSLSSPSLHPCSKGSNLGAPYTPPSLLRPHDSRSTMGFGTVIPTISNTIGAVVVGWGVSSLYVPVSRDCVLYSHLVYTAASLVCFASKSGRIICDIQMIVLHTRFWYVDGHCSTKWCWLTVACVQVLSLWYALPAPLPPPRVA